MSRARRSNALVFQSILCAVDFSPQSMAALQAAARVAKRTGGHVTALCVEDPLLGAGAAAVGYDTSLLRKSTLAELEKLMRRVMPPEGLTPEHWSVETTVGRPDRSIVAMARKRGTDLIVMGTNARRGPGKLFFGSTAEGVLRSAPAAVLVVPGRQSKKTAREALVGRLLGAINIEANGPADARRIGRLSKALGARLTLVHVIPVTAGPPWFTPQLQGHDQARLMAARRRLEAIAKSAGGTGVECRIVLGNPSEEIPAVALDARAGIIVLALRRGHGVFGKRQGTTTYRVLSGSPVPVLALPPTESR